MTRILVVDDEPVIAGTLSLVLMQFGYQVQMFTQPEQAIESIRTQSADILVTDMSMPSMSGVELAHHVVQLRPECRVLILSGRMPPQSSGLTNTPYELLIKPVHPEELLRKLAKMTTAAA